MGATICSITFAFLLSSIPIIIGNGPTVLNRERPKITVERVYCTKILGGEREGGSRGRWRERDGKGGGKKEGRNN